MRSGKNITRHFTWTELTKPSGILEKCNVYSEDAFIPKAMKPIYEELQKLKGTTGAPKKRSDRFERLVTKSNGVWLKAHDDIEAAFEKLFKKYEDLLVMAFDAVFDSLHANFVFLCAGTEAKDEKEKVFEDILRKELRKNLVKVKEMVKEGGAIPNSVEQCKNYATQSTSSQLFVQ